MLALVVLAGALAAAPTALAAGRMPGLPQRYSVSVFYSLKGKSFRIERHFHRDEGWSRLTIFSQNDPVFGQLDDVRTNTAHSWTPSWCTVSTACSTKPCALEMFPPMGAGTNYTLAERREFLRGNECDVWSEFDALGVKKRSIWIQRSTQLPVQLWSSQFMADGIEGGIMALQTKRGVNSNHLRLPSQCTKLGGL